MRSVIVLGYGAEPHLEAALAAIAADCEGDDEIVLVDNGIELRSSREEGWPGTVRVVGDGDEHGVRWRLRPGCDSSGGRRPGLRQLRRGRTAWRARRPDTREHASRRLASPVVAFGSPTDPIESTRWATPCTSVVSRGPVPAASRLTTTTVSATWRWQPGDCLALRRDVWDSLGGFDELYFAYNEDTDLSLRAWLRGWRVLYVPDAIADHHYEFGRSPLEDVPG